MHISENSRFIIWGAGVRGKEICKVILKNGMNVLGFIDKNAGFIHSFHEIPVYGFKDLDKLLAYNTKAIVVISVANVFQHYPMAKKVYEAGFRYIVYKELSDNSSYARDINQAYEAISVPDSNRRLSGLVIPPFQIKDALSAIYSRNEGQDITIPVPVDLVFGGSKQNYKEILVKKNEEIIEILSDKSILYFTMVKNMMRFYSEKVTKSEWKAYKELYFTFRRATMEKEFIDLNEEAEHLQERYAIYQNMELLYNTNMNFFHENPIMVTWNSKGYFNMKDGNHRAAFLFAKGMNFLPCRMSYADYEIWLNREKANEIEKLVQKLGCMMEYPISNPQFIKVLSRSMPFCYIKLRRLCDYFYTNAISIANKRVLELGSRNGFIGQFFSRMGAEVTVVEQDVLNRNLCELIYESGYLKGEFFDCCGQLHDRKFDIVFIPKWSMHELTGIIDRAEELLIVDTADAGEIWKQSAITDNYVCQDVCSAFYGTEVIHTIVCMRKPG